MTFWGIEVKQGKPVTHSSNSERGRLRITQATLGIGKADATVLVQCNVGNRSPVFLCALLPKKTESCHLELEFEEADDVVFSVLGPRPVYLTGYYAGKGRQANLSSDTESYGEDIVDTETGESCHETDEDTYDGSFINDDEPELSPPSPASSDGVQANDESLSDIKFQTNNRRLRKYQISESEDEDILQESEDEDKCLLSALEKKPDVKAKASEDNQKNDMPSVEVPHRTKEGGSAECEKAKCENSIKSNKKRKQPGDDKEDKSKLASAEVTLITNMKGDHFDTLESRVEEDSKQGPKSKKRKHSAETTSIESHDTNCDIVLKEGVVKQDAPNAGHLKENPIEVDEDDKELLINKSVDGKSDVCADGVHQLDKKRKKKKKKAKTQEDGMGYTDPSVLQENGMNRQPVDVEDKSLKAPSTVIRTLSNGLIIEELTTGEPDGKLAALGRKIKVFYTGKLKENGQVFSSNIGKSPFKFRLGNEDIIEGWNVGLEGMHVGEKRRLTIPPSMGYGSQGSGENIPPNSWLVYEIELAEVRR